ncbi:hypothetical protein D8Y22_21605 [Salinadaptatus halalkaliphilus]|uniref:DUF5615 domain-containing protein n=1 Tax=Salinadaptatus halalkaliphilus TaxID=2419781 RepID=A0A4S3THR6_9EURY|nr:DUF5615 family PIN-like protein [Salinadaptatus halalkaliphilus]THE63040.1 hypothetical protein D8Y22_21605 [Salinadaptatus halalkaliphilus]
MRLLCDHNVNEQYTEAFRQPDWITVVTVREVLAQDAQDDEIGRYAAANDWVIFTEDDDHLEYEQDRGVVLYHQTELPSPGDVTAALAAIDAVYTDRSDVREFVPGEWA